MTEFITWRILESKLGKLIVGATSTGCCLVEFFDRKSLNSIIERLQKRNNKTMKHGSSYILEKLETELRAYFHGSLLDFSIPLDIKGTSFQRSVWQALLNIPYGEIKTYADIAHSIQRPSAVRAVGKANGDNNIAILIPCHRVIGSNGKLEGYGGGVWRKRELLQFEQKNKHNLNDHQFKSQVNSLQNQLTLKKWI